MSREWLLHAPDPSNLPLAEEPTVLFAAGDLDLEPLGIYIANLAAKLIESCIATAPRQLKGGLLLGYACRGLRRPFVLVTHVIEGPYVKAQHGGADFSVGSWPRWAAAIEDARSENPDLLVVGWFHSHPAEGCTLTSYDRLVHRRMFKQPWQIAWVIDPVAQASALYRFESGNPIAANGYAVTDAMVPRFSQVAGDKLWQRHEAKRETSIETAVSLEPDERAFLLPSQAGPEAAPALAGPHKPKNQALRGGIGLALALVVVVALLWVLLSGLPGSLAALRQAERDAAAQLTALKEQLESLNASLPDSDEPHSMPVDRGIGPGHLSDGLTFPRETSTPGQAAIPSPPNHGVTDSGGEPGWIVRPGDTMWKISAALLNDPAAYEELARLNRIPNPHLIYPGTVVKVPPSLRRPVSIGG